MEETASTLTVLFEDPFWIGIYERESDGRYQVCKIIFGAEPQSAQVYQYLLQNWQRLRFSPALESTPRQQPALTLSGYNGTSTNNCSSGESAPKPNRR